MPAFWSGVLSIKILSRSGIPHKRSKGEAIEWALKMIEWIKFS